MKKCNLISPTDIHPYLNIPHQTITNSSSIPFHHQIIYKCKYLQGVTNQRKLIFSLKVTSLL